MATATVPRETKPIPLVTGSPDVLNVAVAAIDVGENVRSDVGDVAELADSIRIHGVLQPILVRRKSERRYELVFGHRRLEASKVAGMVGIPAIIIDGKQKAGDRAVVQLVENLQRRDLNPLEEARALRAILDADPQLTQVELAKRIGRSAPFVSNALRILDLDKKVLPLVESGQLTGAHAKALAGLPAADQRHLASLATDLGYSAHAIEEQAKWVRDRAKDGEKRAKASRAAGERAVKALEKAGTPPGTPVVLHSPWNVDSDVVRAAVTAAGFAKPVYAGSAKPWGKCDCTAVRVDVRDGEGSEVAPACVSAEHQDAANRESRTASEARAAEDDRNAKALRKAVRAAMKDVTIHPTVARLLLRSIDGYAGGNWSSYAKLSDAAVLESLADKVSLRTGTAYGQSIPFKSVLASLDKPAKGGKA